MPRESEKRALPIRPKLFLTFAALCISPLLILSLINFRSGLKHADSSIRESLNDELANASWGFQTLLNERERDLQVLASGPAESYVVFIKRPVELQRDSGFGDPSLSELENHAVNETTQGVRRFFFDHPYCAEVALFGPDRRTLFVAQPASDALLGLRFRTKDFLPREVQPDESAWNVKGEVLCSMVSHPSLGEVLRCAAPVPGAMSYRNGGILVADLKLDLLLTAVVGTREASSSPDQTARSRITVLLGPTGNIVYHTNPAYEHQPVSSAMQSFASAAKSMTSGQTGSTFYVSTEGDKWIESHIPLGLAGLSLAVARNYTVATQPARRAGWLGIALSILFGLAGATLLTFLYQRRTQSLEHVKQSVAAIAKGELDQQLSLRSGDDLRPIADNVNLMTERLREQVAREAEAHQFQSFMKLSALLTHDLKNAIAGLSLMVSNIESNFDNPQFRADSMKALTSAADKLRGLVARLSNPVNTMSGEFKLPRPTDLVPLLQHVGEQIADPLSGTHEIDIRLPPTLVAMADGERIEKVMENLVLNAVEAMAGEPGKLTIEAGQVMGGKVFFSVSDTGEGMSPEFIQQRLFHPFATTKSSGVGLGLYTCREVVRANGGTIEVESTKGSGTTFRVMLASAPIKKRD